MYTHDPTHKTSTGHTNIGTITATFNRERAADTVIQVARFVLAGAFESTRFIGQKNGAAAIALPSAKTIPLLQPTRPESGVDRTAGTMTYCRPGGTRQEATIVIDMDRVQEADSTCTGFGRIVKGMDLLSAIRPGTSVSVAGAETVNGTATIAKVVAAK